MRASDGRDYAGGSALRRSDRSQLHRLAGEPRQRDAAGALRLHDPERAHELAAALLGVLSRIPARRSREGALAQTVFGLRFPSPIGLAAGLMLLAAPGVRLSAAEYMLDLPLAAMVVVSSWALLATDGFARRPSSSQ